ncbi:nuclear transport factor 2 family protein [Microbacterium sp. Mu-80]|uniref:Nuclear transport factor 2 family protein n=1 Tax=Microbacterium bandirmense TaxID=3122050 RepID=A0ABU8L876_9MICO
MTFELDDLLAVEREGWDALCGSTGGAFYGALMTPDAVMILVNGLVLDRDAVAASLDGAPSWDRYELSDARMIPVGGDSAALVYRARAERQAEEPFDAVMTSVYVLIDDRPRLALYQQTTATH